MSILQDFTNYYAYDNLMLFILATVASACAIGHLLDKTLGDLAFGMLPNSFLVLMSMLVAVSIGRNHVDLVTYDESARFAILACSLTTGLLLGLGALKAYLLRYRV